ncbi:ribonuclease R [Temperatibacter marinus]|uniref:Ribonuclease R n=1 Tax=Temperatibacter marinus TaxID=1456591 RepID=A0AA52HA83_9PROT|nr:ribonuclease R [Temperatibacter marinus]WND02465.1 ribonuclease R [Temperatibacter marinus]
MAKSDQYSSIPDAKAVLDYIKSQPGKVTKREISRAFGIKGQDKILLKRLIREMIEDGMITQNTHKALVPAGQLPAVQVAEYAGTDKDGDPLLKLVSEEGDRRSPLIYLIPERGKQRKEQAMGPGDKALVRLNLVSEEPLTYRARVIKKISSAPTTMLGIFKGNEKGGRLHPSDKKERNEVVIQAEHVNKAKDGELVLIEVLPRSRRSHGLKQGRVREVIGDVSHAKSISLIAIHTHEIPNEFPREVLKEANSALPVDLGKRTDLRDIPLITIDPADARDHDDAIWAEQDPAAENPGGWHCIVAIADVAHYLKPDGLIDREAQKRGNSCYFPDRVVSMIPESLSAGLCSLMPYQDRATMALHMWFDKDGKKINHKFVRGLMRSAANITYKQAQEAIDGNPNDMTAPLLEKVLKPLYGAYAALTKAREKREPLHLDLPERQIELDKFGNVAGITTRERLDAHKLVEEFMVSANVCAAEELEKYALPCMYRVHEEPSMEKMEALRDYLSSLELNLTKGAVLKPRLFNGVMRQVKDTAHETMVNQVVLRSQTQAYYSPENMGHFGLALERYGHFTSPIRRYADLLVHRALIKALNLGKDGLTDREMAQMEALGEHISSTERRAMTAERDSTDRYLASYLSKQIDQDFIGRISGVTRFGLFVTLEPTGGDGLIPISDLGGDYYIHDEKIHALVGERTGHRFSLGDKLTVKLTEANQFTGGLRLELSGDSKPKEMSSRQRDRAKRSGRRSDMRNRSRAGKTRSFNTDNSGSRGRKKKR